MVGDQAMMSGPEQLIQLSSFIEAQAVCFVRRDFLEVLGRTQVCSSTKPHSPSYFDREVQPKPRVPDTVLALPFPPV